MQKDDDKEIQKDGNNLAMLYLTEDKWNGIKELVFILCPFFQATKFLSDATYLTLSILYPTIKGLFNHMQNNT